MAGVRGEPSCAPARRRGALRGAPMSWVRRFDRWAFPIAAASRLAMLRIVVARSPSATSSCGPRCSSRCATATADDFHPVGVARVAAAAACRWLVDRPAGVTAVAGGPRRDRRRVAGDGPVLALGFLAIATYRSSWGQVLHFEHLLVLHLLVLACSRAGDALRWPHRRRGGGAAPSSLRVADAARGVITVATYVVAGVAKLRIGGWDWVTGDALRHHVAYSAMRLGCWARCPHPSPGSSCVGVAVDTPCSAHDPARARRAGGALATLGGVDVDRRRVVDARRGSRRRCSSCSPTRSSAWRSRRCAARLRRAEVGSWSSRAVGGAVAATTTRRGGLDESWSGCDVRLDTVPDRSLT